MMPLPQFSMMLSLTISSRTGEPMSIPAKAKPLIWLAKIWHWSAPFLSKPGGQCDADRPSLARAAAPVAELTSLLPSIQAPSTPQRIPLPVIAEAVAR